MSSSFFVIAGICETFSKVSVKQWPNNNPIYHEALKVVSHIPSVNDCAERERERERVFALIEEFNDTSKNESQWILIELIQFGYMAYIMWRQRNNANYRNIQRARSAFASA